MTNFVMFTDEHKGPGVHHEAALILKSSNAAALQRDLQKLALKHFPDQARNKWVDLHASPIWNRVQETKGRKVDWGATSEASVDEFFRQACMAINELSEQIYVQRLRVRGTGNAFFKEPERYYAIRSLIHRVDVLIGPNEGSAQVFCDEESDRRVQRKIQAAIHDYIALGKRSPHNPAIRATLLPINFVDSNDSVGVQAADIVAFVYGRSLANEIKPRKDFDRVVELLGLLTKLDRSPLWP